MFMSSSRSLVVALWSVGIALRWCYHCRTTAFCPVQSMHTVFRKNGKIESKKGFPLGSTFETLHGEQVTPSSMRANLTLTFPSYWDLMDVRPGGFVASEAFECRIGEESNCHRFRVKLYPRGRASEGNPLSEVIRTTPKELVGLYLEYLGSSESTDTIDATFALRLKGQQIQRRFDVEWRAGMRFVSNLEDSNLPQGIAKDCGAPLMQTSMLPGFMGIEESTKTTSDPIQVEAEVCLHDTLLEESLAVGESPKQSSSSSSSWNQDIRLRDDGIATAHDTEKVRVGKVIVPILSRLSQRPKLFEQGTYPGVEYRVLRILKDGEERFTSCPGAEYELQPVYPLVPQLERPWPVTVREESIPKLYTPSMYNILSAVGSLFTAISGLFVAFLLSQAISLFFIPSKSMDPTLKVGDVLLVDKVSPRILSSSKGDIVLFSPPDKLQDIVSKSGGNLNKRDLFVKRIAASPGDAVKVLRDGTVEVNDENVVVGRRDLCEEEPLKLIEKYIDPTTTDEARIVEPKKVFVMGDCSSVSVDSRVWGALDADKIVGKPIVRLWPLDRFGKVE